MSNPWLSFNYKPKSVSRFIAISVLLHAVFIFAAYQAGFFTPEDIDSIPARTISVSIIEPTPIKPPPPVKLPEPKPKKKKIITRAPSTKKTTAKPIKKLIKPLLPTIEQKIGASPLPTPVSKTAVFHAPQPSYQPKPKYPKIARRRGTEGIVIFEISVANDGHVNKATIIKSSGSSALDRSAHKAIKTWQFPSSQFNSLSTFKQKIEFRLNGY